MPVNKQFVLESRPTGPVAPENFRLVETPVPVPGPGQVLVRHHYLSLDPYMRGRLNESKSYAKPQELGAVMGGGTVGEVVVSHNARLKPGDKVVGMGGWQEYSLSDGRDLRTIDDSRNPDPGLSRAGRHARRDRLVRAQQDHRAQAGRDHRRLGGDWRGRFGGRPARQDRGREDGRHRRRPGQMRLCARRTRLRPLRRPQGARFRRRAEGGAARRRRRIVRECRRPAVCHLHAPAQRFRARRDLRADRVLRRGADRAPTMSRSCSCGAAGSKASSSPTILRYGRKRSANSPAMSRRGACNTANRSRGPRRRPRGSSTC